MSSCTPSTSAFHTLSPYFHFTDQGTNSQGVQGLEADRTGIEGQPVPQAPTLQDPWEICQHRRTIPGLSDSMTVYHARTIGPVASSFTTSITQKGRAGIATGLIPKERQSQTP